MSGTLFIALAVVGSIALIIFILVAAGRRQQRRKDQELRNAYRTILAQHNLVPDHEQIFTHRICALDSSRRTLVFVQHHQQVPHAVIELDEVVTCRRWKDGLQVSRPGKKGAPADEYISALGLSFLGRGGAVTTLPFYTEALDGVESKIALSKAADHWLERLNKVLV